jgi:hypothetical protein
MKNYRLFLLNFAMASFISLTGFQKPSVNHAPLKEKQIASLNVKAVQFKSKKSLVKQSGKDKHFVAAANNTPDEDAEFQKMLDLSIPFNASENAWLKTEQNKIAQKESSTIFINGKKKSQPIHLDGKMLMSQEPEVDKQKSLDGAGIVIILKR